MGKGAFGFVRLAERKADGFMVSWWEEGGREGERERERERERRGGGGGEVGGWVGSRQGIHVHV